MTSIPAVIGHYKILDVIGRGGMGVVYRAEHSETGEPAAVKTVYEERARIASCLRSEIQVLARLRHPGIVKIFEEGMDSEQPWFAMEYIRGVTLRDYFDIDSMDIRKSLTPEQLTPILTMMRRICEPLAFLHGEGLVHKDIKPENILVRENGYPVIMDFGITGSFGGGSGRETLNGGEPGMGTLLYMAPEQLRSGGVDARADLYAMGCIFYELLTGAVPYGSPMDRAQSRRSRTPPKPSTRTRGIPRRLDQLVAKLIHDEPDQRVGYASDIARSLVDLGAGEGFPEECPQPRLYLHRPRFAGRKQAFQTVDERLTRAALGRGAFLCVSGESGIGKTRFAQEIAAYAAKNSFLVIKGECEPVTPGVGKEVLSAPFQAFQQPLLKLAEILSDTDEDAPQRVFGQSCKVLAQYIPTFRHLPGLQKLPDPPPVPREQAHQRLFESVHQFLANTCRIQPVLMVIDDVQWADNLSLRVLDYLIDASRIYTIPLILIVTYRPEELPDRAVKIVESPTATGIQLAKLDTEAINAIVTGMLASRRVHRAFVQRLTESSGGNPFFVSEYLRSCMAEKILTKDAFGNWLLASRHLDERSDIIMNWPEIPGNLQQLIHRRLDLLPDTLRMVANKAAVLGREFDHAILTHLADKNQEELAQDIRGLMARQIFEEIQPGKLRFLHGQIQTLAYQLLERSLRRDYHRHAATILERLDPEFAETNPVIMGNHWEQAGEIVQSIRYYIHGAQSAFAKYSLSATHDCLNRIDALLSPRSSVPDQPELLATAHRIRGQCYRTAGQYIRAEEEFQHVIRFGDETEDPVLAAIGADYIGGLKMDTGELDAAHQVFEENLQRIPDTPDNRYFRANTQANMAMVEMRRGQLKPARDSYLTVRREMEKLENDQGLAMCDANLGLIHCYLGDSPEAEKYLESAMALYRSLSDHYQLAKVTNDMALIHFGQGHLSKARGFWQDALDLARKVSDQSLIAAILGNLAVIYWKSGQYWEAGDSLEESLSISRQLSDKTGITAALINLAALSTEQGDRETCLEYLDEAIDMSETTGEQTYAAFALHQKALCHITREEYDVAETLLDRSLETAQQVGLKALEVECSVNLAWLEALRGDIDAARFGCEISLEDAENLNEADCVLQCRLRLAEVLILAEDLPKARAVAAKGLKLAQVSSQVNYQWHFFKSLGNAHLMDQNESAAYKALRNALDIVVNLGNQTERRYRDLFFCQPEIQELLDVLMELAGRRADRNLISDIQRLQRFHS